VLVGLLSHLFREEKKAGLKSLNQDFFFFFFKREQRFDPTNLYVHSTIVQTLSYRFSFFFSFFLFFFFCGN
jgi:hypothetical protein